jgi:hypothetical protein
LVGKPLRGKSEKHPQKMSQKGLAVRLKYGYWITNIALLVLQYSHIRRPTKANQMLNTTFSEAKRDFEIGYLTRFEIIKEVTCSKKAWRIHLTGGSAARLLCLKDKQTVKLFKSLDSAVEELEKIGFRVDCLL